MDDAAGDDSASEPGSPPLPPPPAPKPRSALIPFALHEGFRLRLKGLRRRRLAAQAERDAALRDDARRLRRRLSAPPPRVHGRRGPQGEAGQCSMPIALRASATG